MPTQEPTEPADDTALRLAEYKHFITSILDSSKHLNKFSQGMKGLRETAIKTDRVIIASLEAAIDEAASHADEVPQTEKIDSSDVLKSTKENLVNAVHTGLKERRTIDKHFDSAVENLCTNIIQINSMCAEKIMELIQNIENSHAGELMRLKVQIADLVTAIEDVRLENEALKAGVPKKPKQIPSLADAQMKEGSCPICRQLYKIDPNSLSYKCSVCSFEMSFSSS